MTEFFAKLLSEEDYKGFEPVYEDFRTRATTDYNFELEPLTFEDFIDSVKKELIKCIILREDGIPTAFLVYTTMISEAVELNIIHSLNMENFLVRSKYLLEEFLNETKKYLYECRKYYDYKKSQQPIIEAQKEFEKKKRAFLREVKMSKESPTKKQLYYYDKLCKKYNLEKKELTSKL